MSVLHRRFAWLLIVCLDAARGLAAEAFPGTKSAWFGFDRYDFEVGGKNAMVVAPKQEASGRPWVWHGEFFGHKPNPDLALLGRGFHVVYLSVPDMLGSPTAVKQWDALYAELTGRFGFAPKPALVGLSRGGLYCYNWAIANPERVACIYGDAPVCDFRSWPGAFGKGKRSDRDWQLVRERYGFGSDDEARAYPRNPVDQLAPLAAAGIPLLHVFGDADEVVPWDENTGVIAERYPRLGGSITLIRKPGVKHHPHGLDDSTPIVDFIWQHAGPRAESPRPLLIGYLPDYRVDSISAEQIRRLDEVIWFSLQASADGPLNVTDRQRQQVHQVRELAGPNTRVLVAVGGWGRSEGFGPMSADPAARAKFIRTLTEFCLAEGLAGVDLDWEFPRSAGEKSAYDLLLGELHAAFAPHDLKLTMALNVSVPLGKAGFAAVDRVHLMAYDFGGGRHSTMPDTVKALDRLADLGVPPGKVALGTPFYGRSLDGRNQERPYRELVSRQLPAPEADEADGFGFNGPATLRAKLELARQRRFAGLMIWEIGQDVAAPGALLAGLRNQANRSPAAPDQGPRDAAGRPLIRKLGTVDLDLVETTPVVLNGRLWRFEWVRQGVGQQYWDNRRETNYFRFRDPATGEVTAPFADGHEFGSAFVHGGTVYVTGTLGRGQVNVFASRDLQVWETWTAIPAGRYGIFNTSVCRAGDEFVMMFEIDRPESEAGTAFTARFAKSPDLRTWTLTPPECHYAKDRYTAPHCLRWMDGWFYDFYLEAHEGYEMRVVRSRDLIRWEASPLNPVLRASAEDKAIANAKLTEAQRQRIAGARNLNNSDLDFCEWQGRLTINYSWGNQQGVEHLAEAVYDGSEAQFLRGWFPE